MRVHVRVCVYVRACATVLYCKEPDRIHTGRLPLSRFKVSVICLNFVMNLQSWIIRI
jgi:hypothetical protein